ncbi:MAG: hypothetical protein ACRCUT_10960 [Spirochaetota bacterium]
MLAVLAPLLAQTKTPISGFAGSTWGMSMADVRKNIKGKIIFDDEKKLIVTRDGEINYRYGFFYKIKETAPASGQTAAAEPEGDSKFFFALSEFPYISLDKIREKMVAQYGEPTGDNIKNSQGALLWDSGDAVAIVWVDAYEKKPFCRKISYISKNIAKELNTYQDEVFNKKEREIIKNLVP